MRNEHEAIEPTTGSEPVVAVPDLDREILMGVRRRDPKALARFFDVTFDMVYSLAYRLLGDRDGAEDIAQDVFLKVYGAADRLDVDRSPRPWLTTITYNLCRDFWRRGATVRKSHEAHGDEILQSKSTSADDTILENERAQSVQRAILSLDESLRMVVVLHDYEGMSHDEIATMVGASHAAIRKRYSRALARLREQLRDEQE